MWQTETATYQRFEAVVAGAVGCAIKLHVAMQNVSPDVAGRVLGAIDADEGAEAVVGVHTEVVDTGVVAFEGDRDVKADVAVLRPAAVPLAAFSFRGLYADVLVPQELRAGERGAAVARRLVGAVSVHVPRVARVVDLRRVHVAVHAGCEFRQGAVVAAIAAADVEAAVNRGKLDAPKDQRHVRVVLDVALAARLHELADLAPVDELLVREADRALVGIVAASIALVLNCGVPGRAAVAVPAGAIVGAGGAGGGAVQEVVIVGVAYSAAGVDRHVRRGAGSCGVHGAASVADGLAGDVGPVVRVPKPVAADSPCGQRRRSSARVRAESRRGG